MDRQELRAVIERLGFLDYVEEKDLVTVREGLLDNIINKKAFFFPHGKDYQNINGRVFSFDPEELTEGGALDLFNKLKPSLQKAGLKIEKVEQAFEGKANSRTPDYKLIVNDKVCNLGVKSMLHFLLWAKVAKRFTAFLNSLLKANKIKERIYFMNDACSDTDIAFLTPAQMKFINSLELDPKDKVYKLTTLKAWKPVYEVTGIIVKAIFRKKRSVTGK